MAKPLLILFFSFLAFFSSALIARADFTFNINAYQNNNVFDISPFASKEIFLLPGKSANFTWYDKSATDDQITGLSADIVCYPASGYRGTFLKQYGPFKTAAQQIEWEVPKNSITVAGNPQNCFCQLRIFQDLLSKKLLYKSIEFRICQNPPQVLPYIETLQAQKDNSNDSFDFLRAESTGNGSDPGLPKIWFDIFKKNTPYRITDQEEGEKINTVRIQSSYNDDWKGNELWRKTSIKITEANNFCYQAFASNSIGAVSGKTLCNQNGNIIEISKPRIIANDAANITNTTADISASILDLGNDPNGIDVWFNYNEMTDVDTDDVFTTIANRKNYRNMATAPEERITELKPCTSYYFYPVAHNDWGYQLDKKNPYYFTTTGGAECNKWTETTKFNEYQDIRADFSNSQPKLYLTLWGRVYKFGAETTNKTGYAWFLWDKKENASKGTFDFQSPNPKILKTINILQDVNGQAFKTEIPIEYNQSYCWKAAVDNRAGAQRIADNVICSPGIKLLRAEAEAIEVLGIDRAKLIGIMNSNGGYDGYTDIKFQYWKCENPEGVPGESSITTKPIQINYRQLVQKSGNSEVTFSAEVNGLQEGQGYCFRTIAQNGQSLPYTGLIGRFFTTKKNPYVVTCQHTYDNVPSNSRTDSPLCNISEKNTYATNAALQGIVDKQVISDEKLETWFQLWEARAKKFEGVAIPDCQILPEPKDPNYWPQVGYKKGSRKELVITVGTPELKRDTAYCVRFVARNGIGVKFGDIQIFNTRTNEPKIIVDEYTEKNVVPVIDPLKPKMVSYNITGQLLDNGGAQNPGADIFVYWWMEGEIPKTSYADPIKDSFFITNQHRVAFASAKANEPFAVKIGNDHIELDKVYYYAVYARNLSIFDSIKRKYSKPWTGTIYRIGPQIETLDPLPLIEGKNIMRAKITKLGKEAHPLVYFRICSLASPSDLASLDDGYKCQNNDFENEAINIYYSKINPKLGETLQEVLWAPEIRTKISLETKEANIPEEDLAAMVNSISRYGYMIQACIKTQCSGDGKYACKQCGAKKVFYSLSDVPVFKQAGRRYSLCSDSGGMGAVGSIGCGDTSISMALSFWYKNDKNFKEKWDRIYPTIKNIKPAGYFCAEDLSTFNDYLPVEPGAPTVYKFLQYAKSQDGIDAANLTTLFSKLGLDLVPLTGSLANNKKGFVSAQQIEAITNLGIPFLADCMGASCNKTLGICNHHLVFWRVDLASDNFKTILANDSAGYTRGRCMWSSLLRWPASQIKNTKLSSGSECGWERWSGWNMSNMIIYPSSMRAQVGKIWNFATKNFQGE